MEYQIKDEYKDVIGYLPNLGNTDIRVKRYRGWSRCFLVQNCMKMICETFNNAISNNGIQLTFVL